LELLKKGILIMNKKILIIAFIVCSIFAVNYNVSAAEGESRRLRKAGGFDRDRPNNFTTSMKNLGRYLLLYIPNRCVDALDIISIDLTIGGAFGAEVQATRYFQIGGSYGESYFVGMGYSRQFGAGHKVTNHAGFFFMEKDVTFVDETTGTVKEYVIDFPEFLTADRDLDAFRDKDVDFWKVGGNIGWIIGIDFGIHPLEVADFVTGIFWFDPSEDDF
jgi:hypothetical protein